MLLQPQGFDLPWRNGMKNRPATAENLILATCTEAEHHRLSETDPLLRERVERSLAWAKRCLKRPLQLPKTQQTAEVTEAEAVLTGQDARQILERPRLVSSGSTVWDDEERTLVAEQLSRSSSFLGAGHEKVQKSFVLIVGVGAVGSSAAILLARAGLGRLRLVDGGIVQSISAHAVATAADFGRPKVEVCKETNTWKTKWQISTFFDVLLDVWMSQGTVVTCSQYHFRRMGSYQRVGCLSSLYVCNFVAVLFLSKDRLNRDSPMIAFGKVISLSLVNRGRRWCWQCCHILKSILCTKSLGMAMKRKCWEIPSPTSF